jgi:hypothetical protein
MREKDHFERPRHRWENNIKINLEVGAWSVLIWLRIRTIQFFIHIPHNPQQFIMNYRIWNRSK